MLPDHKDEGGDAQEDAPPQDSPSGATGAVPPPPRHRPPSRGASTAVTQCRLASRNAAPAVTGPTSPPSHTVALSAPETASPRREQALRPHHHHGSPTQTRSIRRRQSRRGRCLARSTPRPDWQPTGVLDSDPTVPGRDQRDPDQPPARCLTGVSIQDARGVAASTRTPLGRTTGTTDETIGGRSIS
jgi:hypothetical protein